MKKSMTIKGFTLVELIVVIAIIGVLAAILVPSMIGYVKKAQRRADVANAKRIYDDIMYMIAQDDERYVCAGGVHGGEYQTVYECLTINDHKTHWNRQITVNNADGTSEIYQSKELTIICKMDGATNNGTATKFNGKIGWDGIHEASPICEALSTKLKFSSGGKYPVPIASKELDGNKTNRWLLCYRGNDPTNIEIWVGDGNGGGDNQWGCNPRYRLYPNPCKEYVN